MRSHSRGTSLDGIARPSPFGRAAYPEEVWGVRGGLLVWQCCCVASRQTYEATRLSSEILMGFLAEFSTSHPCPAKDGLSLAMFRAAASAKEDRSLPEAHRAE